MFSPNRFLQVAAISVSLIYLLLKGSMQVEAALNQHEVAALEDASRSLQADLGALPAMLARNPNFNSLDSASALDDDNDDDDGGNDDDRFNGGEGPQLLAAQQIARKPLLVAPQPAAAATDLSGSASYHKRRHHHGHHAKGWLEMGAWSGKKGAFGWHDKHPVGKKGRK